MSFQGAFPADSSQHKTKTSSQDEHVEDNETNSGVAISDTVSINGSAEPQSVVINGEKPEPVESPPPTQHTISNEPPAALQQSEIMHTKTSSQVEHLKVTGTTNGSPEPQSVLVNDKQPEPAETPVPTQHATSNKAVPVPRARTRVHTFKAEAVMPTETNAVKVHPLSANNQISVLPRSIPRSNTVGEMALDPLHEFQTGATTVTDNNLHKPNGLSTERQRSQTLPRRPPRTTARRNPIKEDSGPTAELQTLLARRRQWEQNDTTD